MWDELVVECRLLLHNVVLQVDVVDPWLWHLDSVSSYFVKGVSFSVFLGSINQYLGIELLWHKEVLVKVSLLAW